jgi:hypothetical protein
MQVGSQARVVLDGDPGRTARRPGDGSTDMTSVSIAPSLDEEPIENVAFRDRCCAIASVVPRPTARTHRIRSPQRLAWCVQEVLVGCGLAQGDYSGAVGHVPQVVLVVAGPRWAGHAHAAGPEAPTVSLHTSRRSRTTRVVEVRAGAVVAG